jgi:hypothetical protein
MSTTPDKLVEKYLKHLEVELDDLPRARRREIVDEISGHIAEARADLQSESEADVRNILDHLGDPAEIATEARERFGVEAKKSGFHETATLIMLLVGGLVIPVIGWLVGVILLWSSNVWNTRDKLIGTLFVPGGLGLTVLLLTFGFSSGGSGSVCDIDVGTGREFNCTPKQHDTTSVTDVLGIALLIVLLVAPIVSTAYLAYRMRTRPVAAA